MSYLKRYAAPKSWIIARKETKYITSAMPGAHKEGMPVSVVLQTLGYGDTTKEIRKAVINKDILVDGKKIRRHNHMIGLMDTLSLPQAESSYRMIIDKKGRLIAVKITKDQASTKPSRIINKIVGKKGIVKLCTNDGRNVAYDKKANVGDTVILSLPDQKVKEHLSLEPKATILLTGGRHIGEAGVIESISGDVVRYKSDDQVFETRKEYAFVIPESIAKLLEHEHDTTTKD